ncbi:hypothetical protein INT45_004758 [Circinella minor]|uniref:SH3 domain-containing protein n=1 Tax=Circinella minor TaxID=1195481 RepID=A0A8H7SGD2_9FUNG|nr:hypothetical protein INT45_004758 [Circinella minor]
MSERDHVLANYMLASIQKDLGFLKDNQYLNSQTYNEICALLPSTCSNTMSTTTTLPDTTGIKNKPPLPTRKSAGGPLPTAGHPPVPAPRSLSTADNNNNTMPKLPTRRSTNEQQQQQQQQHLPAPAPRPQPSPRPSPRLNNAVNVMPMPAPAPAPAPAPTPVVRQHHPIPAAEPSPAAPPPAYSTTTSSSLATVEAIYDYEGDDPKTDLSFHCGDVIQVTEYVNDDWWRGELHGKSGIFPQNHVKKIASPEPVKRAVPPKPTVATQSAKHNPSPPPPQQQQSQPIASSGSSVPPYSYPPPPTTMYHAPPQQPPSQAYYAPPPPGAQPVMVQGQEGQHEEGNKVTNMTKKFGGKVGEAAVWGFGATLGSQAASAIF